MKSKLVISSLLFSLTLISSASAAEQKQPAPGGNISKLPDSQNQIVKLTDRGVEPSTLTMKQDDVIVFFLNESSDSLATLQVDFGMKATHCATSNLKIGDGGKVSSVRPFGPTDFASICLHDLGTYDFKVFGLKNNPKGIASKIVVTQ